MVRIAGVELPNNKRIEISLTYIYGIGRSLSNKILDDAKISRDTYVKDITDAQANKIREELQKYEIEGDKRRSVSLSIKRMVDLGIYRGLRHRRRMPVRGQRTRTNARTRKGPKKFAGKKK